MPRPMDRNANEPQNNTQPQAPDHPAMMLEFRPEGIECDIGACLRSPSRFPHPGDQPYHPSLALKPYLLLYKRAETRADSPWVRGHGRRWDRGRLGWGAGDLPRF